METSPDDNKMSVRYLRCLSLYHRSAQNKDKLSIDSARDRQKEKEITTEIERNRNGTKYADCSCVYPLTSNLGKTE